MLIGCWWGCTSCLWQPDWSHITFPCVFSSLCLFCLRMQYFDLMVRFAIGFFFFFFECAHFRKLAQHEKPATPCDRWAAGAATPHTELEFLSLNFIVTMTLFLQVVEITNTLKHFNEYISKVIILTQLWSQFSSWLFPRLYSLQEM